MNGTIQKILLPGGVVLVVAALGIFAFLPSAKKPPSPGPGAAEGEADGFVVVESGGAPHRVLLEAEAAATIAPPMHVLAEGAAPLAAAGGGKCLYLGPEKVNETPETAKYKKGHPEAAHPGFARFVFTVPETDDYALWVRAFWVDDCGDSVGVSVNGAPPRTLAGSVYGDWSWTLFRTGDGSAARIRLDKGKEHVLVLTNREDDLYIDQILLRGTDRPWPAPRGIEAPNR